MVAANTGMRAGRVLICNLYTNRSILVAALLLKLPQKRSQHVIKNFFQDGILPDTLRYYTLMH